jgi:hypothetical protein
MDTVRRNEQIPSVNSNEKLSINRHHYQNGEFPLQKPRVYTHDDRSFVGQQQQPNVLSSSSASSILSVKDKHIKEVGETRYNLFSKLIFSLQNSHLLIKKFHGTCFAYCFFLLFS